MSLNSGSGIIGIILLVIGIILLVIGIILMIVYRDTNQPWIIWLLLGLGVIAAIIGIVMIAVSSIAYDDNSGGYYYSHQGKTYIPRVESGASLSG